MTKTSTVTLRDGVDAAELVAFLAPRYRATADGPAVRLGPGALAYLAGLDEHHDGHYDGAHIWIGGTEYPVDTVKLLLGGAIEVER
jgi:hypothetical protein